MLFSRKVCPVCNHKKISSNEQCCASCLEIMNANVMELRQHMTRLVEDIKRMKGLVPRLNRCRLIFDDMQEIWQLINSGASKQFPGALTLQDFYQDTMNSSKNIIQDYADTQMKEVTLNEAILSGKQKSGKYKKIYADLSKAQLQEPMFSSLLEQQKEKVLSIIE